MRTKLKVKADELYEKYPHLQNDINRMWRTIIKEALIEQVSRNPNSRSLRGIKSSIKKCWPYFDDDEANKVTDMICSRFSSDKGHNDWNSYRGKLPKIFPETILGQLIFSDNKDGTSTIIGGIPESSSDNLCVIIIKGSKMNAQFTDVPQDTAYSILSELSKSLA
jgi:hypothetical protein